jgi:hypothetical protein
MREKQEKKMDQRGHIETLFFYILLLLKRFQQDNYNHTMKDHQMRY